MNRGALAYILGRIVRSLSALWVIATIIFLLFRLAPGNPMAALIDTTFTAEQEAATLKRWGLDRPLGEQYIIYIGNLLRGDLGDTFFYPGKSVTDILRDDLPNTLYLTLTSLLLAYLIGTIGGVILAARRGTNFEKGGIIFTLLTRSAASFWVGMILLAIFAFRLRWFPSSGIGGAGTIYSSEWEKLASPEFWRHMALPTFTLALFLLGLPQLLMRSNMLDVLDQDYVTMSRLAGYSERRVMIQTAARNALLPVLTALTIGIGYSIGGNVVLENVFAWPGLGRTLVRAVSQLDYPLAQGAFFIIAVIMVTLNFLADVLYTLLDPRIGASSRAQLS